MSQLDALLEVHSQGCLSNINILVYALLHFTRNETSSTQYRCQVLWLAWVVLEWGKLEFDTEATSDFISRPAQHGMREAVYDYLFQKISHDEAIEKFHSFIQ